MSSDLGDEGPEIDDKTISEVVRKPTRTAGDLSEVAGARLGLRRRTLPVILKLPRRSRGFQPTGTC
jgi:hypothetical protein